MPSDDSSAEGKPPFILKADSDNLVKNLASAAMTMEQLMESAAKKEAMDLRLAKERASLQGLHVREAWLDEVTDFSKYNEIGAALGISGKAAHDLTNAFLAASQMTKEEKKKPPLLDEMMDELEGWITTFRTDLPEDPVSRTIELIERGDEMADFASTVMHELLEEREGRVWMQKVIKDLRVEYVSTSDWLVFRLTCVRGPDPDNRGHDWVTAVTNRPQVEEGFIPVEVLEDADQNLKLKRMVVQIAADLAAGPRAYKALLPSRRMYDEPTLLQGHDLF